MIFVRKIKQKKQRIIAHLHMKGGFGMNELLGIAAALIIAAFIIIPGLRSFTGNIMSKLNDWWNNTIVSSIFPT